MTYKELLEFLQDLSDEQLSMIIGQMNTSLY